MDLEVRNIRGDTMENTVTKLENNSSCPTGLDEGAIIAGAVDITKHAIQCLTEYMECKEHEKTERKRITAELKAAIYRIDAQKEICLRSLENEHEQKMYLYSMLNKAQEKALEMNDKDMLSICYKTIMQIYLNPSGQKFDAANMLEKSM